ncbi:MFS transporter [Pseudoalteromonas sp. SMS1]|uniref:MFS transporter n=1 Tax=Pseudoalteromonas sp. SMS1 TaxID=2908894 RepID=UPI001F16BC72|nr:MFS transporter [Pseudoalteromonas sp. SMS1]MCF2858307.1 MFS transporter [Pseudoalteromonas sp. SMS1]
MNRYIALAALLTACSQLASQIFMPVLPDIADSLSLSAGASQAIIISFFLSLGSAQLLVGPLCDKYGERPIFVTGQVILIIGTGICALAQDPNSFMVGRVLQGVGCAAPILVSRAVLYACFQGAKLHSAMGTLAISASVVALTTPLIAGTLAEQFSWQGMSFVLIGFYICIFIFGLAVFPKPEKKVVSLRPNALIISYKNIAKSPAFIPVASLKWAPTFLYLTLQLYLPFFLRNEFAFTSEQIGQAMMISMSGLLIGSTLAKFMQKRTHHLQIAIYLWPALPTSALTFLLLSEHVYAVIFAHCAIMFIFGSYFPSYMYYVGYFYKSRSSTANALVGATELLLFSSIAWAANQYLISGPESIALLTAGCAFFVLVCLRALKKLSNIKIAHKGDELCNSKQHG